jgi:hypothetical protein
MEITLEQAVQTLARAGVLLRLDVPSSGRRALTLAQVEERIGFGATWIRSHLGEFPNAWRAPGGGRNGGELRIPERDIEAFEQRQRIAR